MRVVTCTRMALLFLAVLPWKSGWAYCVSNQSDTAIHVQSLDASRFVADMGAGEYACCLSQPCRQVKEATLLVVTGFVPVTNNSRPGWKAECRAAVAPGGLVKVTGQLDGIECASSPTAPAQWLK